MGGKFSLLAAWLLKEVACNTSSETGTHESWRAGSVDRSDLSLTGPPLREERFLPSRVCWIKSRKDSTSLTDSTSKYANSGMKNTSLDWEEMSSRATWLQKTLGSQVLTSDGSQMSDHKSLLHSRVYVPHGISQCRLIRKGPDAGKNSQLCKHGGRWERCVKLLRQVCQGKSKTFVWKREDTSKGRNKY